MAGLSLIVGLGNPGRQYEETRHNAGFWLLDEIARDSGCTLRSESRFFGEAGKATIADRSVWLLKPMTYMNLSGKAVAALARFYKIDSDQILVLHDELDFGPGTMRLKKGGGTGGHNGVTDIRDSIGSADFRRLRIGIGRPADSARVESFVLNKPPKGEYQAIFDAVYRARNFVPALVEGKFEDVMNELHRDTDSLAQKKKSSRAEKNGKQESS